MTALSDNDGQDPTKSTLSMTAIDAIFVPIDLEASLGRIEDDTGNGPDSTQQQLSSAVPNGNGDWGVTTRSSQLASPRTPVRTSTRTSSKAPEHAQQIIAPFPVDETPDEVKERQKLVLGLSTSGLLLSSSTGGCGNDISPSTSSFLSPIVDIGPLPFSSMTSDDDDVRCGGPGMDYCLPVHNDVTENGDDGDEDMIVSRDDLDFVQHHDDGGCDVDDDDFSLSAEEADSLQDEDLHFDRIKQDPVSFWEAPTAVALPPPPLPSTTRQDGSVPAAYPQRQIPDSVSFSSHTTMGHGHDLQASGMDWYE